MRDFDAEREQRFFDLFTAYFDSEKDAGRQHDIANYSLDRMYPLAKAAGSPERGLKIIHVAGTKGKGSTCHFLSALLKSCGYHVGLFTSPHLSTVRERFQLDDQLISYDVLEKQAVWLLDKVRKAELTPSMFELFTVLGLKLFAEAHVDYVILETGIGGRLDATNYVTPCMTVIAPISFDHMALLGNTIEAIAGEKAGILKQGIPVALSRQSYPAAEDVILSRARTLSCPVVRPLPEESIAAFAKPTWAPFLRDNFRTALAVLHHLGVKPEPSSFIEPQLRARCEVIRREPLVILDAAHNGDSMRRLVEALHALYAGIRFTVIIGIVKGKDAHGMVEALKSLDAEFILTNPHTGKGSDLEKLSSEMMAAGLEVKEVIPSLQHRDQLPENRPLLFTGSFFTALIGEKLFD